MLQLCQKLISLTSDVERASYVVELSKTVTIGDVVVLDRACSFSLKSVIEFIQRIDPLRKRSRFGEAGRYDSEAPNSSV
jgi:hypothetical protein